MDYAEYMAENSPEARIKKLEATIELFKNNLDIATATKVEISKDEFIPSLKQMEDLQKRFEALEVIVGGLAMVHVEPVALIEPVEPVVPVLPIEPVVPVLPVKPPASTIVKPWVPPHREPRRFHWPWEK